jgi:hypothetical protein
MPLRDGDLFTRYPYTTATYIDRKKITGCMKSIFNGRRIERDKASLGNKSSARQDIYLSSLFSFRRRLAFCSRRVLADVSFKKVIEIIVTIPLCRENTP